MFGGLSLRLRLGLGARGAGASGPVLPYAPVFIVPGDSNGRGTTASGEQAAMIASYTVSDKVLVRNMAGAWVTYTPGTMAGIHQRTNDGTVGAEMEFIKRFRAAYPNDTLYLIKDTSAGSYQTRGASIGTITGSISGGGGSFPEITFTGTLNDNDLIVGSGVPTGFYAMFNSAGGRKYVGDISRVGTNPGATTVSSTSMTRYNSTASWSSAEGGIYNGISNNASLGAKARWVPAVASVPNGRVVGIIHVLGTNDAGSTTTADRFANDLDLMDTRLNADLPLSNAIIATVRVGTGGTPFDTVRAAQAAKAAASAQWEMIDTDDLTRWDGTHWNAAGLNAIGDRAFDFIFGG